MLEKHIFDVKSHVITAKLIGHINCMMLFYTSLFVIMTTIGHINR